MLSEGSRKELLAIARACLGAAVRGEPAPEVATENPQLATPGGCFVTCKNAGRLRGCIGCFESAEPIYQTVARYAAVSATQDPRFSAQRITPRELPEIDLEISVLSPREKIADPLEFSLGVHGIYVEMNGRSGCFLPQVATEHKMSREQFLSDCCAGKAGLSPDAWRDPDASVYVFTAEIISEKK